MVGPTLTGQQTAQLLVQKVSRAFYNPRQSIVLDNLIQKPVMKDTELAGRLGINTKELMKSANILITDQIIATFGRLEMKENAQKASNQTYYYINYSHAINVIKWRMWKLQNTIDSQLRNELEAQGYVCPKCKKTFTTLDAASLYDPFENRMRCDVCGSDVEDNSTQAEAQASKDRLQRLIKQTASLRDLLKKMDEVVLPEFDDTVALKWLEDNVSVGAKGPAAGSAAAQQAGVRIQLQGEADEEEERRRVEAEAEEKRQQNQLPSWIANSTISGEASSRQLELAAKEAAAKGNYQPFTSSNLNPNTEAKPDTQLAAVTTAEDDLEAYYATLAAEADETATVEPSVAPTAAPSSTARSPGYSSVGTPTGASLADMDEAAAALEREMYDARSSKRARSVDTDGLSQANTKRGRASSVDSQSLAAGSVASDLGVLDDDEFEDEFEDEDEDPNPMISVAGRMVPFLDVDEGMQQEMTPEEYERFFDVFSRIG